MSLVAYGFLVHCAWCFYRGWDVRIKFVRLFSVILYLLFIVLLICVFFFDVLFFISNTRSRIVLLVDLVNMLMFVLERCFIVGLFFIGVRNTAVSGFWSKWVVILSVFFQVIFI